MEKLATENADLLGISYMMGAADSKEIIKVAKEIIDELAESLNELRKIAGCRVLGTGTCLTCDYLTSDLCNTTGKDLVLRAGRRLKRLEEAKERAYKDE
jgi:hypothetical protein